MVSEIKSTDNDFSGSTKGCRENLSQKRVTHCQSRTAVLGIRDAHPGVVFSSRLYQRISQINIFLLYSGTWPSYLMGLLSLRLVGAVGHMSGVHTHSAPNQSSVQRIWQHRISLDAHPHASPVKPRQTGQACRGGSHLMRSVYSAPAVDTQT